VRRPTLNPVPGTTAFRIISIEPALRSPYEKLLLSIEFLRGLSALAAARGQRALQLAGSNVEALPEPCILPRQLRRHLRSVALMQGYEFFQFIEQRFPLRGERSNHFGNEDGLLGLSNSVVGVAQQEQRIGIGRA
jgi:hypothetical protein